MSKANVTQKTKKLPVRHCVGCNESKLKSELCRIVRTPEGNIEFDPQGKRSGRGAYICRSAACLAKAKKSKRLERNLGCEIPDEIYSRLEEELAKE